jgi:2-oxoglutarate dehydrogenase E2 component (dihydrolipoamide succinyltransferase)
MLGPDRSKVDTEVQAPASGTLTRIVAAEDETVPVGAVVALVAPDPGGGEVEVIVPALGSRSWRPDPPGHA